MEKTYQYVQPVWARRLMVSKVSNSVWTRARGYIWPPWGIEKPKFDEEVCGSSLAAQVPGKASTHRLSIASLAPWEGPDVCTATS